MIVVLIWRPQGLFARAAQDEPRARCDAEVARRLARARALAPLEIVFWLVGARRASVLLPGKHLILNEIAILALFALSLDLILGYAGIVSLGHAAFFGFGAYAAGLLAKHGHRRAAARRWLVVRPRRGRARLRHQLPGAARLATSRA